MARVTVEDCVDKVPNRFELVLLAAQRTRDIRSGSPLTVDQDDDKNAVVALREIAEETVDIEKLRHNLEHGPEVDADIDEPDEDAVARDAAEASWARVTGQAESSESGEDSEAPEESDGADEATEAWAGETEQPSGDEA